MSEPFGLLIAGLGTLLSGVGFWLASRRSIATTYTADLEKRLALVEGELQRTREKLRMTEHDLERADKRIEKLLDRMTRNDR